MRNVRIRVKLCCSSEQAFCLDILAVICQEKSEVRIGFRNCYSVKPFALDILAVICQKKSEVKICFRIRFINLDHLAECRFGGFLLAKPYMSGA